MPLEPGSIFFKSNIFRWKKTSKNMWAAEIGLDWLKKRGEEGVDTKLGVYGRV